MSKNKIKIIIFLVVNSKSGRIFMSERRIQRITNQLKIITMLNLTAQELENLAIEVVGAEAVAKLLGMTILTAPVAAVDYGD